MPKCTEDWDKCSGFWGCIIPAVKTAGKCTVSYIEDTTHQGLQFHRSACLKAVTCTLDKYQAGEIDRQKLLQWLTFYLNGWTGWSTKQTDTLPAYWQKEKVADAALIALRNSAQHQAGQTIPQQKYGGSGALISDKLGAAGYGAQVLLPTVGGFFSKSYKAVTISQFSKGPCPQFSDKDVSSAVREVVKAYAKAVAAAAGGEVKTAYEGLQLALDGKPSEIIMQSIFSLIEDLGYSIPDEVKGFLSCLYSKAGAGVLTQTVMLGIVQGNPKEAGQLIAPYAIDCGAKTLKDQLDEGSPFRPIISAIAIAVEAYIAPSKIPQKPPAPKPPVAGVSNGCGPGYIAGPKGDCLRDPSGCGPNQFKSLDGKCKDYPKQAPGGTMADVRTRPAEKSCMGPWETDPAKRCAEYNTPFWDNQRKIAAAGLAGGTGPDASMAQQAEYEAALASYKEKQAKGDQNQMLLLVGVAVVAYLVLSK